MKHKIVKTTTHRQRDRLKSAAPGVVGPYWVGRHRSNPSPFTRVDAEFWLVPQDQVTASVARIAGINFPVQIEIDDLHPFMFSKQPIPSPRSVIGFPEEEATDGR